MNKDFSLTIFSLEGTRAPRMAIGRRYPIEPVPAYDFYVCCRDALREGIANGEIRSPGEYVCVLTFHDQSCLAVTLTVEAVSPRLVVR